MLNFRKYSLMSVLLNSVCASHVALSADTYDFSGHHVYVNTNAAVNKIIHYAQTKDGRLVEISKTPTMGAGTAGFKAITGEVSAPDSITSSGALTISRDHKYLFVVNAGEGSVSSFSLGHDGEPLFIDKVNVGHGSTPNSVSYNDTTHTLYVGHLFGPNHIDVIDFNNGHLKRMPGSHTVNVDDAADRIMTQVQLDPENHFLLANIVYDKRPVKINGEFQLSPSNVTRKNGLAVFPVLSNGDIGKPKFYDAGGQSPFGLRFIPGRDGYFVNTLDSDPGTAVLSHLDEAGAVTNLSIATLNSSDRYKGKIGTCWVSISADGKYAYVSGYDAGEIESFRIDGDSLSVAMTGMGTLNETDLSTASAAVKTGAPIGNWSSSNGYLYQLYPSAAKLIAYKMQNDTLARVASYTIPLNSPQGIESPRV